MPVFTCVLSQPATESASHSLLNIHLTSKSNSECPQTRAGNRHHQLHAPYGRVRNVHSSHSSVCICSIRKLNGSARWHVWKGSTLQ